MSQLHDPDKIKYYLRLAVEEATKAVTLNKGLPFGAVIVDKNNRIIAQTHNLLFETNDPTAHAEVTAIRQATSKIGHFQLNDCVMYSSCQPCAMCYTACLWSKLEKVYYAVTESDCAKAGFPQCFFDDPLIADEEKRRRFAVGEQIDGAMHPMDLWNQKSDRPKI